MICEQCVLKITGRNADYQIRTQLDILLLQRITTVTNMKLIARIRSADQSTT